MPVTITWDQEAPLTGQPDAGSASKVYTEPGTAGTVTVTDEAIGGPSRTLNYTVPLGLTNVVPTPAEVDSSGDEAARTVSVAGENFPPNMAGQVAVATGPAGAYGTTVISTAATTNAAGIFTGQTLVVPSDTAAGDYHLEVTFGDIADLSAALTVVNTELPAPTGLASPSQTSTTVELTWDAVTEAEQYEVRWSPAGQASWTVRAPVDAPAVTDTVTGLQAETSYDFQVRALAAGSTPSPWSATFNISTPPMQQLATPQNLAPDTPNITANEVPLSWDAVTGEGVTYTVSWRSVGGQFTDIPDPIVATNYTVTGLDPLTDYEFRVKAVADGYLDSAWSTVESATTDSLGTLSAPTGVNSPAQTTTSVDIGWTAVTDAEQYIVQWAPTGTTNWTQIAPVAASPATVGGLTTGTTYDFQVQATATGWTESPWSATFTQATA